MQPPQAAGQQRTRVYRRKSQRRPAREPKIALFFIALLLGFVLYEVWRGGW